MRELLTPPGHRGPLIAAGATVLTVGVLLEQIRITPGAGVQFLVPAALAALLLWLVLQGEMDTEPPGWASVMLVAGLLALFGALLRLADVLGDPFTGHGFPSGTVVWTGVIETGAAGLVWKRRNASIALLIAAVAGAGAFLSLYDLVFSPHSQTPYRWLLLLLGLGFGVASLSLRDHRSRHAEQLANAGGLALAAIGVMRLLGGILEGSVSPLGNFWEFVLLAAGLGLVAYAAADTAPGPAYVGVLNLLVFAGVLASAPHHTLKWWPLLLLVVGGAMMLIGLRPRQPLPPPPEASTRPADQPLAARSDD